MTHSTPFTHNPYIDFVTSHIASIILFSGNGISIGKRLDSPSIGKLGGRPLVALFPKGLPYQNAGLEWKPYNKASYPCLITTSYSIGLIAEAVNQHGEQSWMFNGSEIPQGIVNEIAKISILQLDYCIENLKNHQTSPEILSTLLDGCISVVRLLQRKNNQKIGDPLYYQRQAATLHNRLCHLYDTQAITTIDLSRMARSVSLYNQYLKNSLSEPLAKMALEILHRRNKLGLFQIDAIHQATIPLSSQFHIIESLLLSYPSIKLDVVFEESFNVFNTLFKLAWKSELGLFSFRRGIPVRYSAYDIGCIIRALNRISYWTQGPDHKEELLEILNKSYIGPVFDFFFNHFSKGLESIHKGLIKTFNPHGTGPAADSLKFSRAPIFPDTIYISHPGPYIKYNSVYPVKLRHPLFLCSCLLEVMSQTPDTRSQAHDNIIDLLLKLFENI